MYIIINISPCLPFYLLFKKFQIDDESNNQSNESPRTGTRSYLFSDSFRRHFGETSDSKLTSTNELTFVNIRERKSMHQDQETGES